MIDMPVGFLMAIKTGGRETASVLAEWPYAEARTDGEGQKRPYIVMIEDNPGDVLLVEEALRQYRIDCELKILTDGEQAVRWFDRIDGDPKSQAPDLVLLDLNLPKRTGHEILQRIRQSMRCSKTPVVIVTSSQAESDLAKVKQLGFAAYFQKPASFDAFMKLGALVGKLL